MELHEWLQQLKDKVMQHLELLMQRGDIKGPPYIMPDDLELTFLRKFIERQQAGIPHNPRLREAFLQGRLPAQHVPIPSTSRSGSDGPGTQGSDSGWGDEDAPVRGQWSTIVASADRDIYQYCSQILRLLMVSLPLQLWPRRPPARVLVFRGPLKNSSQHPVSFRVSPYSSKTTDVCRSSPSTSCQGCA